MSETQYLPHWGVNNNETFAFLLDQKLKNVFLKKTLRLSMPVIIFGNWQSSTHTF